MSDEEEIRRLLASYAQLVDGNRLEEWTALFAPDGTFKAGTSNAVVGREAILSEITRRHEAAAAGRKTKHLAFNSLIDVKGNEATAVSDYFVFARTASDQPWLATTSGKHHDRLVKVDGRWLFQERINRSGE